MDLKIVRERRNLGRTEEEEAQGKCLQYDVIQWLCFRDQTYSQVGLTQPYGKNVFRLNLLTFMM